MEGLQALLAVTLVAALAPLIVAALPGPRIPQVVILRREMVLARVTKSSDYFATSREVFQPGAGPMPPPQAGRPAG